MRSCIPGIDISFKINIDAQDGQDEQDEQNESLLHEERAPAMIAPGLADAQEIKLPIPEKP